jgi:hypothetical protein
MGAEMTKAEAAAKADRLIKAFRDAAGPGLKELIASHGGLEGYNRWVRGLDDPPSPVDHWIEIGEIIRYSESESDR